MQLVDLAGSERWNVKAGSQPLEDGHARELQAINTSLSALLHKKAIVEHMQKLPKKPGSGGAPTLHAPPPGWKKQGVGAPPPLLFSRFLQSLKRKTFFHGIDFARHAK